MKYSTEQLDSFVASVAGSFYSIDKKIVFKNFNPNRVSHNCALCIGLVVAPLWHHDIYVQTSWINFQKLKKHYKDAKLKRVSPLKTSDTYYNIEEEFWKIVQDRGYNYTIVEQVFNEYYKGE